jgi:hypothetical protein
MRRLPAKVSSNGVSHDPAGTVGYSPPKINQSMKTSPLILTACVFGAVLIAPFASSAFASLHAQARTPDLRLPKTEYPIGENCVITVDPSASSLPSYPGQTRINTGFVAPGSVRGVLTKVDDQWLILKEGINENWIPRDKVLLLRVGP